MKINDKLKEFDAHSSVSSEFRVHTSGGAVLSIVTLCAIGYLIYTELAFNFQTNIVEKVHANATSPTGLELEFDITLHSVPCAILSVDANDPTGQKQSLHLDKIHHVWKHRMSSSGEYIGERTKLELGSTLLTEDSLKDIAVATGALDAGEFPYVRRELQCGSCYGAGEEGECCETCDDVKRAYGVMGWVIEDYTAIEQCKNQLTSKDEHGEGCNVHGIVALSTGGGNIHLAPSRELENSKTKDDLSIFDIFLRTFEQFNVSHTINLFRFGPNYPGHIHQLDHEKRIIEDAYGMYQYYIQVVPTLYRFLNGSTIQTNQFSVTEHMRHVNPGSGRGLPGVFFFYEVSALHVEIEEYKRGFVLFFTSVAAIIGGVVTIMGMIDKVVFSQMGSSKSKDLLR